MKYVTYLYDNKESVGFLNESDNAVYPLSFADMNALIEAPKEKLEVAIKEAKNKILLSDVTLLAPIPRPKQDVICLGINYKAHAIEELSSGMTLMPGTIIATGTPSGVGMGFDPPKFLKSGDMVECSIEGIGTLCNVVR
ncbi:fumarylacetoacetate hydrolase family protein [Hominiventricola sp. CLA-AA-H78B]|uniref:Fumarylacetoacetate hydrolase family protein n=1 Tax=Hominiventricola aquisgranensis TaxID=3133164 RepID=A0ABV1I1B7_9FIRM